MNDRYERVDVPTGGEPVAVSDADANELDVPDDPIVPIIHGDGTGAEVGPAAQRVLDEAAEASGREIHWMRVYAGESARERYGANLPDETVTALEEFRVGIKGPLTTPVGAGFRSLNVALRTRLDLYANVRPATYLDGVPSPRRDPGELDVVVFRENTEDVYAGVEWEAGTEEAERVREFVEDEMGEEGLLHDGPAGFGVKPISEFGTKRLVREAIDYALDRDRDLVTLVHKGNIMKFTEGGFRDWGYEVAEDEYGEEVITEDTLWEVRDGEVPDDAVVVNDRIADNMLQQLLTRTDEYDVLAMPNLNGDYLSDAAAAQTGSLGISPGINVGDGRALAEPVHGSAPRYAGQDKVNPTAMIRSGALLFEYLGWDDAADAVDTALRAQIESGRVTYDIERNLDGGERLGTSEFATEVAERIAARSST
ncbi:NADP-dependent isocitrate dehydrogenase [Halosimplex sp. TS25]|uniref:NADP-dependent isocitrate dehydrogenase n=1 Tax=Halosimplex rarum TaxID=3396619 RepID=UPI0039EADBC7